MLKVMIFGMFVVFFTACAGRQDDTVEIDRVQMNSGNLSAFGWKTDNPSLVVFAAGWCKPCIKEIPYIEKLSQKYADQLEVFGYLVEGQVGGQAPTDNDIENFNNNGVRTYPVYQDASWELMSSVNNGPRILPAIYIFGSDRRVIDKKEGSISEEELTQWVEDKLNFGIEVETVATQAAERLLGPEIKDGNEFPALEFFEFYEEDIQVQIRDFWEEAVENSTGIDPQSEEAKDYQIDDAEVVINRDDPDEEVTITHIKLDEEYNTKCYTIVYMTLDGEFIGTTGYCLPNED